MSQKRAIALNMIANTSSFVFATVVSFFLTPYITRNVGIEAYGLVGLANSFISYVTLFTSALNSMASRFIVIEIHNNRFRQANEYFSSVLIANTLIALILVVPSVWLICNLEAINVRESLMFDAQVTFSIVIFSFFVSLVGSFYGIVLYAKNLLYKGSFRTMESNVIRLVLILLLFSYLDTRIFYVALATFLAGLYPLVWNIRYTRKMLPELRVSISSFTLRSIKTLVSSGIWNSVTKLSQILLDGLDLLLCNIFIGGVMTGNVAVAKTLPGLFIGLVAVLSDSFYPRFLELYSKKMKEALAVSVSDSVNLLSAISGICLSILIVYAKDFYDLWLPGQDSELLAILTILSLGTVLVSSCIYSLYSVFALTNKVKTNSLVMVASGVVSVSVTFVCLKTTDLGVYAIVGVSSVVGLLRNLLFTPVYAAHCLQLRVSYFYGRVLTNLLNVALLIGLEIVVRRLLPVSSWFSLIANFALCALAGLVVTYFIVFPASQRRELRHRFVTKMLRRK